MDFQPLLVMEEAAHVLEESPTQSFERCFPHWPNPDYFLWNLPQ